MSTPDDPTGSDPTGIGPGAPGTGAPGPARRHGAGAYDAARQHRQLLDELDHLRNEIRNRLTDLRSEVREETRHTLRPVKDDLDDAGHHISLMMPRLDDLEARVSALGVRVEHAENTAAAPADEAPPTTPGSPPSGLTDDHDPLTRPAPNDADQKSKVAATPALNWDHLSREAAETAWSALAEFVDRVLHRQYQLTRLQVPDCWPLHPRLVRELAWLRTTYHHAAELEDDEPTAAMSWHIRAIPGYLININEAIDPRECRPGVHRLTEYEVSSFAVASRQARNAGAPAPRLTSETGHDRPHIVPAHYPTRVTKSTAARRGEDDAAKAPTVDTLPEFVVGSCHPDYWGENYLAAKAADLAERH